MAQKTMIACCLVAAVIFLVYVDISTALPIPMATRFCHSASDRVLCHRLTAGAHTKEEAMQNAVKSTMTEIDRVKNSIEGLNGQGKQECSEAHRSAIEHLKQALAAVPSGSEHFEREIEAALFSDCTDYLKQLGINSPVIQFNDHYDKMLDSCLAVSQS